MGDHQEGALVGAPTRLEVPGQPGDALNVEVVGGFVKHDDVVVFDEEFGQRNTALLAAG